MNIIVCVKQVIAGDQVKIDPRTHSLVRSAEFSRINPFDLFALDMAVRLKREDPGSVTAVSMGPRISEEVLWEALSLGADRRSSDLGLPPRRCHGLRDGDRTGDLTGPPNKPRRRHGTICPGLKRRSLCRRREKWRRRAPGSGANRRI
jgi:hypothetical protein